MLHRFLSVIFCLTLLLPLTTRAVKAAEKSEGRINLSDEIYADLALRHELNHVSLYYFDGNINNTISINADKNWDPASTIKLYVAMYAFDQIAAGKISLGQIVTISDQNVAPGVSIENGYAPLAAGEQVSVYELLDRMITQSGNTSYNTLLDLLDRREVTKYIHDLGLVNSSIGSKLNLNDAQQTIEMTSPGYGENITNANDFARAFILINGKRLPGSPALFDMLSRQKLNEMIPANLPKDVVVAHKTGELDPFYHDGGIIVGPGKSYILSIFTDDGDPSLVAHISQLIYTEDSSLIGIASNQAVSDEPLPPIDPLVAEANGKQVLAATTQNQNITLPPITASDVGIVPSDLNSALGPNQLPPVLVPTDSPIHFLVDAGYQINSLNPIPGLRVNAEASGLKLKLAEANNLISKNKISEANRVLGLIDASLTLISKDKALAGNINAQTIVNQVSETRFEILKFELANLPSEDRTLIIKEIAHEAKNAANNIVPNIPSAIEKESLAQAPVIGKIIASTINSLTVQTPSGNKITVEADPLIKTRDPSTNSNEIKRVSQIETGTEVAIAGTTQNNKKASFILTNVPVDSTTQTPVSVVKVDVKNNILVVSKNGIPTQVDLTKKTVIKGSDDSASINDINPGDVLVVHGSTVSGNPQGPSTSQKQNIETTTLTKPSSSNTPSGRVVAPVQSSNLPNQPAVIKGKVIEIVGAPAPKTPEKKQEKPAPQPTAPIPENSKDKKK